MVHQFKPTDLPISHRLQARQRSLQACTAKVHFRRMCNQFAFCEQSACNFPELRTNTVALRKGFDVVSSHLESFTDGGVPVDVLYAYKSEQTFARSREAERVVDAESQLTEYSTSERNSCSCSGSSEAIFPPLEDMAALQISVDPSSEIQSRTSLRLSDVCSLIFLLHFLSL